MLSYLTLLRRIAMNAAVVHAFDAPPRYTSFDEPVAAEGEAIVNVSAAGLHQIVKLLAKGTHYGSTGVLPFIPGVDGVGRLQDGTRVLFGSSRSPFGTFAERSVTARTFCIPAPEGLDDATIAGITNPGMSSWAALTARAQFAAGESVLILGATGVAGQLAVQIAKRLGARRVIAAGRNAEALDTLKHLGADVVISLDQEHDALVSSLSLGKSGGERARSNLAEGTAARRIAYPLRADRGQRKHNDLAAGSHLAQFRP
jgi:NADPH2:quinone reductase